MPSLISSFPRLSLAAVLWIALHATVLAGQPSKQEPTVQGPLEILSPVRDRIVLNGIWKALPAVGPSVAASVDADWGLTIVPGSWYNGFIQKGTGPEWNVQGKIDKAWYEREIDIPTTWKGRRILLDFRRVSTDASVSVNGTPCGDVSWPYGQVDITKAVTPGSKATVQVLVSATTAAGVHLLAMGPAQVQMQKVANKLASAGLIGEVFMLSEPQGAIVTDVFVQPSFRKKQVSLEIEVTGMTQEATVPVTATMINAAGQEEQVFHGTLPLQAMPVQQTNLTFPWSNPALWSPEHPNLYKLRLEVTGPGISDIYPERFGFREFWVDGKKFFLNGQEIRLRPTVLTNEAPWTIAGIDGYIDGIRKAGFNIIEQQPINLEERGSSSQNREIWCEQADEKGFLTIGDTVDFGSYISKDKQIIWFNPGVKESLRARLEVDTRRYRNHPSVVMYTTTANRFGQFQDQNPRTVGVREITFPLHPFQLPDQLPAALDAMNVIRAVDPTRPVYSHASDQVGDVYTVNTYLDLIPLQEREEWLSNYAEKGDMPFMAVEFGLPLANPTMQQGRNGYGNASGTQPLETEFCAIYLGPDAYRMEPADYRSAILTKFDGRFWTSFHGSTVLSQEPAFQQLEALFIRNTWRSWRAAGDTGGMIPWDMLGSVFKRTKTGVDAPVKPEPGGRGVSYRTAQERLAHYLDTTNGWEALPASNALVEVNGPTLAWIAGAPENFYEKAHSFRTGQAVKKQICLINDLPNEAPYHVHWKVIVAGKTVHEESADGKIAVATNLFLPLSFSLPATIEGEKAQGEIDLDATIGGRASSDKFPFGVFNPDMAALPKMFVFDPEGRTSNLLKTLGADVAPWNGEASSPARPLLVIGRQALSGVALANGKAPAGGKHLPGDLEKFVNEGGRLLVISQDPNWMQKVPGFRINRQVSRRFFPVMKDHPLTAGLDADDLRDWAGAGTLVEPRPVYKLDSFIDYGWHWGNQGSVSSAAVEKPHYSGWTPILEGEFDLAYSPLMELAYGQGAVVLCTLDLEDQASVDPVAEILARRILRQTVAWTPPPRRKTVFLGGDADAKLLQSMGLLFDRATSLPTTDDLAIVGSGATVTEADLKNFASQGGNVFVMAAPVGQNPLGLTIQNQDGFFGTREFQSSFTTPLAGLSVSDLHFRTGISWPILAQGDTTQADGLISSQAIGKGTIVATQLNPDLLNADHAIYFHFTRWRQTRAISQLLANLGASFAADDDLFHPSAKTPLYRPDFNPHVWDGDDPARYYRW